MSEITFSVITAVFTIGGLAGSLIANLVMDRRGRKGATVVSALLTSIGAGLMSVSTSVGVLGLGRFVIGLGSGVGICVGPIYLAEIAPSSISGNVGVLTQLGIVLGIMITQAMGLRLATPTEWRTVLFFSFALSAAQLLVSSFVSESPIWLENHGRLDERRNIYNKLWVMRSGSTSTDSTERSEDLDSDPLLDELEARREDAQSLAITVPQLFLARELRKPLAIVCLAMASQQLSEFGPYVSLGITVVNVLMTFPPIVLIEVSLFAYMLDSTEIFLKRVGRRRLLAISTIGALVSLLTVGFGLNTSRVTLSSIAILTFVMLVVALADMTGLLTTVATGHLL
ncbi:hypothetical protein H0H87_006056 [Tephrocybe sp. NHM501043]|nr:hypothetical protein H0H87_006056 [Tephrocybe sp. NHM501043]